MLEFLNQNAGALTVIFTGVVTISTVVYAFLTARLVVETQRMRKVQTEPKIEVAIRPYEEWISIIHMNVRNIGLGPAYDISFSISAEKGGDGALSLIKEFGKANFLSTGLAYLGPNQELKSGHSQMTDNFEQKIDSILVVNVRYRNASGNQIKEEFRLDFSEFRGRSQTGRPPLYAIAQHLEKMQRDFNRLAIGFNRIKVDIYNSDDREQESRESE